MKWFAVFCALCVAICWGLYGPTLTNARSPAREWGPFKPYVFIGVAYLVIAIVGGAAMMKLAFNDNFDYSGQYFPAMKWGFLAGCLGALGALALTFSLTKAGGKPAYVMPIVFGGAVTVNGHPSQASPWATRRRRTPRASTAATWPRTRRRRRQGRCTDSCSRRCDER